MARFTWIALVLAAGCASVPPSLPPSLERIAALEDARSGADELAAFAQNADPLVRARAATALGRLWFPEVGAEVTSALLGALGDADANVRAAAAFALGVRGDPSAADQLLVVALDPHAADKDALVRARALEAATKLERPELRERMLDGLLGPDPRVRLEAAEGASRWPTSDANAGTVNQRLVDSLASEQHRDVIVYTLFALERRKAQEALDVFLRFYREHDAEKRVFAVRGLASVRDLPGAADALFQVISGMLFFDFNCDGTVLMSKSVLWSDMEQCEALRALAGLDHVLDRSDKPNPFLLPLGSSDEPCVHVRRVGWETVAAIVERDPSAYAKLQAAGLELSMIGSSVAPEETSPWVRGAMYEASLRWLKHDSAPGGAADSTLAKLGPLYSKFSTEERIGILRGVAALDAKRALPVLLECVKDPQLVVSETAIEMLAKFPTPQVREALHQVLAIGDNGVRLAAVTALAEMPDASDFEPLKRCYETSSGDGTNEIRFNVLRAAGKIGGDGAWNLLMKGLADSNAFVRRVAREELAKLDPQSQSRTDALALAPAAREVTPLDLPTYTTSPLVDVVTNRGTLRFELFPDEAPVHVANFLALAAQGHYDGTTWHRVVPDFVIQGGDYRGDGNGGGTWKGQDQSLRHEITPRKYVRGSLGMPRNEDVDSGGSQIFVTHRPTPHLDGRYTIFGELRGGFDVLDAIEVGDTIVDVKRVR